jgi:hypothetical protein
MMKKKRKRGMMTMNTFHMGVICMATVGRDISVE